MNLYKSPSEARDAKKLARTTTPSSHKLRNVVGVITLVTVVAGASIYKGCETNPDGVVQVEKSHSLRSDFVWDIKYHLTVNKVVKEQAAKMLGVDAKEITLSSNMSQPYRAVGLDTKFSMYHTKWIEASSGNQSILFNVGQPMENIAREQGGNDLDKFLSTNLESMAMVARLRPSASNKWEVIVTQIASGQAQEEATVNLSTGAKDKPLAEFKGFAFSALTPELAMQNGAASILKFDGEKFMKDSSYSTLTFGGDRGYYLDDRGAGIYFKPDRTLLRCGDINNPNTCVTAGLDGDIFNQNTYGPQDVVGVRGIRVFLIRDKDGKDKIYPVPEGGPQNYNQLFDQLVTKEGIAGALPAQK